MSNLAQARHARNIEHQLSNLNESVFNESSLLEDSSKRIRYDSVAGKCFTEGKKHMKNGQFEKGMTLFSEHLAKDGENLEAKYLLGVCAFHLENY